MGERCFILIFLYKKVQTGEMKREKGNIDNAFEAQ